MRLPVSLDDQIAYQEGELERILKLYPRMAFAGCMSHQAAQREIDCQTAILATLTLCQRALASGDGEVMAKVALTDARIASAIALLKPLLPSSGASA